jgi:hypothetical protein
LGPSCQPTLFFPSCLIEAPQSSPIPGAATTSPNAGRCLSLSSRPSQDGRRPLPEPEHHWGRDRARRRPLPTRNGAGPPRGPPVMGVGPPRTCPRRHGRGSRSPHASDGEAPRAARALCSRTKEHGVHLGRDDSSDLEGPGEPAS